MHWDDPMPREPSAALAAINLGQSVAGRIGFNDSDFSDRRGPIRWLVLCGIMLIAAIALGTAIAVGSFRQRALETHQHELENTALLLTRHFDQQLEDFGLVQKDIVAQIRHSGIAAPDVFKGEMSTLDMHEMLRAKVSGSSNVAGVNIFAADGALINSSETWPVPDINIADRKYFISLKSSSESASELVEIAQSRLIGKWTVVLARKIVGPDGEFFGLLSSGVDPDKFEDFFRSMALPPEASIGLFHTDVTLLARHPHVDSMIGQNFKASPVHQQVLSRSDHGTIQLDSPIDGFDRLASARRFTKFQISIIATTTVAAALADWREQTRLLILTV